MPRINLDDVKQAIQTQPQRVISLVESLLPNGHKTAKRIVAGDVHGNRSRKGKGQGSFAISLKPNKLGVWCDSATGDSGDLIGFIMANQSLGFTDALALLASELGVVDDWQGQWQPTPPSPLLPHDEPAHPIPQWQGYTPIDGTPAERYLVGRGITLARLGLLTWPKALGYGIYTSKSGKQHPALFSHDTNAQGETQAIQAVLLTRDGQKLPCDKPKQLLKGSKPNGSACRLWPRFDAEYSGENPVPLPITLALCVKKWKIAFLFFRYLYSFNCSIVDKPKGKFISVTTTISPAISHVTTYQPIANKPDIQKIYLERVKPTYLDPVPSSRKPKYTAIIGMIGSGKTTYINSAFNNSCLKTEVDELRKYHPDYNPLSLNEESTFQATSDLAHQLRDLLHNDAIKESKSVVYSYAKPLGSFKEHLKKFKDAGYSTEIIYLLTHPLESEASVYTRYQDLLTSNETPRIVTHERRIKSADVLFTNIEEVVNTGLVDQLKAVTRDNYESPIFSRQYPYKPTNFKDRTDNILNELNYEAKISRNIKTPIVNSETLSSALSSQILSQQDRETICKLNKMIQVSKHVEANDPKSIEIGGKEYNIKSVFSELNPPVFELEEVSQECELSRRFYKLDELNLDALYDGEYYSEIIPIDDTLHLRNPYTNKKTTIPLENIENDSLKTSRKDLVFLAGDGKEYAIVKIAPDTMAVLLETKKEKLYLPLDKMPNNFECLLKGKLGHGAYEISNSSTGLTAKHPSSHSWQPISNDDIEPTLTNYHHTELGKIYRRYFKVWV